MIIPVKLFRKEFQQVFIRVSVFEQPVSKIILTSLQGKFRPRGLDIYCIFLR